MELTLVPFGRHSQFFPKYGRQLLGGNGMEKNCRGLGA
jgi:hypothetical protein